MITMPETELSDLVGFMENLSAVPLWKSELKFSDGAKEQNAVRFFVFSPYQPAF